MAKEKEQKSEPLEKQLWKAACKLQKNIDAAEYKHIVLFPYRRWPIVVNDKVCTRI